MRRERPPEISSVQELIKHSHSLFMGVDSFDGMCRNVEQLHRDGHTAVIEGPVLKFLEKGPIHAERYTEAVEEIINQGDDPVTFSKFSIMVFDMFGPKTNDNFMRSYPYLVKKGLQPEVIFDHLAVACRQGGRKFGSIYIRELPVAIDYGGDPQRFRSNALYLNRRGGFKIARSFMNEARAVLLGEKNMSQMVNGVGDIIDNYGKDAAFWSMPGIIDLLSFTNYSVSEYLGELSIVEEKLGEKATNWFAYGVSRIGKSIRDGEYQDRKEEKLNPGTAYLKIFPTDPRKAITAFKDGYFSLYPVSRQAAIFLARTTTDKDQEIKKRYEILAEATKKVTKKSDLSKALWLISKICTSTGKFMKGHFYVNSAVQMVQDFATYYPAGRNDAMHALNITNLASRIDMPFNYALIYPKGKNIDEPDPNWELRYEEPSPVVVFEENNSELLGKTQYDSENPNWEIREEIPEEEEIILPETTKDTYEMSGHEKNVSELEGVLDFRRTNFVTSDIEDAERANLITNEGSDDKKLCPEPETQFFIKHHPGQTTLFDSNSTPS
jgi:hypothetical protein